MQESDLFFYFGPASDLLKDPNADWYFSYNTYAIMNSWLKNGWSGGDSPLDTSVESRGKVVKLQVAETTI
jgi:hypothetical protein